MGDCPRHRGQPRGADRGRACPEGRGRGKTLRGAYDKVSSIKERFREALEDDFNTALGLGYLHELARFINRGLRDKDFRKDPAAPAILNEGKLRILEVGGILGLFQETPSQYFSDQQKRYLLTKGLKKKIFKT